MTIDQSGFSFPQAEQEVLGFWEQHNVFKQSLEKTQAMPVYTFYDGPPFATGLPHHGHLLASTIKDIIGRYYTMTGHHVERRFGWDCHGLPVEYEIDKKLGQSTDEIVAERGISGYNQECRAIVQRYTTQWRSTITRLGRWVDFEHDYKTMDPNFMESVWWVFKQLWDQDLIYQGTKVVPFSTALGTGLSNFEAGSNYQEVQDPSVIVLLPLVDQNAYLAIWTTTPWTLPSNLGVCVNANIPYLKVKDLDTEVTFYIAKDRHADLSKHHKLNIINELAGSELAGLRYQPLFPYFQQLSAEGAFRIHCDNFVTTEDGTGLVHMAPAFGEDDARVAAAAGLTTVVCPIDNHGCFTADVSDFAGQYVKDADKHIIKHLKEQGLVYDHQTIVHSYPFCPRSDTPLIYRAIPSWYVKVEALKDNLLKNNQQIHWVPDHIQHGRFGKWLAGARDWAISRSRVWGTPLPLWINDETNNIICIGSIAELEDYTQTTVTDLHRDKVDPLTFSLANEPGCYRRITEVLDCWFESGAMPYAQQHYPFENQAHFEQGFPADFIAEGLDQTRGWFYTLSILATALFKQPAFKNVIVTGLVNAEDGKKMSKRLRNYTPPDDLMQKYGADALRLYLINSGLVKAEEQRFRDEGVKDMVRRTLLPWYNSFKFFVTYANVDQFCFEQHQHPPTHILDHWILSRLHSLIALIQRHMSQYKLYNVVPELLRFIDELTNVYIRLNRARFWAAGMENDKRAAFSTLFTVIKTFSMCMACFAPFLAEHIYRQLLQCHQQPKEQPISIHLCDFPDADTRLINTELERAAQRLNQILILGRQQRNDVKIKIKTPLRHLTVIHKDKNLLHEITKLEDIIKRELNIKEIDYRQDENQFISLYAKPNSPVLGRRLGKRFAEFRQLIEALSSAQIETLEEVGSIQLQEEVFSCEDILIFREVKTDSGAITNRYISIVLDCTLDQELVNEGLAREVINRIQKTRKDLDFNVSDRIDVVFNADKELGHVILQHHDYICQETLALSLKSGSLDEINFNDDIEQHNLQLQITLSQLQPHSH